uniref:Uncharacterized protein n=1 Tax=Solanum lycopersicum TaxID=4081 RepID=A0A3Q7ILH8_SOLLC
MCRLVAELTWLTRLLADLSVPPLLPIPIRDVEITDKMKDMKKQEHGLNFDSLELVRSGVDDRDCTGFNGAQIRRYHMKKIKKSRWTTIKMGVKPTLSRILSGSIISNFDMKPSSKVFPPFWGQSQVRYGQQISPTSYR